MKTYRKVSFSNVDINMGFWQKRQQVNRDTTIYAIRDRFLDTGRFEAIRCQWREGMEKKPHIFWDSDIAKWMESVAYLVEKQPMPELEALVEETIDCFERQQDFQGYVNSFFTGVAPSKRWKNRWDHELYCAGHLMEAAVAWYHATGKDRFLKVMCRYADYIDRVFRQEKSADFLTPGHEEIELALVKLYHATGEKKYLDLSQWFIDQRGNNEMDFNPDASAEIRAYSQSHLPCAQQMTAEGHSVRAGYLYSAMADIAYECDDKALQKACETLFENIVKRRMYITGGVGSSHRGEAFTIDYDLPNETAYTETCAAISMAFFANRMLLLDPDAKYADLVELEMYNGFLAGLSLDGKCFFYTNPLEIQLSRHAAQDTRTECARDYLPITQRVEVFDCSCCPPNVTRFLASLGDYVYTESDDCIYLHQYLGNSAHIGGAKIQITTEYPREGIIHIQAEGLQGKKTGASHSGLV